MQAILTKDQLTLTFTLLETRVLYHILGQIIINYQTPPENLDRKAASVWYSTKGCKRARMSPEDTREWLRTLHQYRSANTERLEKWRRQLSVPKSGTSCMTINVDDTPILLTALNDHRLLIAAQAEIGQEQMDAHSLSAFNKLPSAQQRALSEIHFLASIMEELLQFLPDNPGDWTHIA